MNNFDYYAPTKVVFGKDTEKETGRLVKEQGASSVLVHFGGKSAIASGLLDRVCQSLKEEGIAYETLGGVVPNPRLSKVREGIALCREKKIDFILAVGGGSVIDSAKAIGYGVANEGDVWDFYAKKRVPTACLPIGAVLTIAAAGSEMSNSSVITNEDGGLKRGCNTDLCRCRFAVMNPELTYTLPDYQTQCGCTDIMMHTMERYFNMSENMELTDGISEALIKTVMKHSKILKEHPDCYESRAEVMWASSLSHNGLTGCGTDGGDWACHQLEHEIGGMFDVAHGAGLAAVWGSWARYVYKARPERFAKFARNIFDIQETDDEKAADFLIMNTCTVRENANQKVYGHLGMYQSRKKKAPHRMIAICGCMMQEPDEVAKIRSSYRFVDIVFGTHNIFKLAELLYQAFTKKEQVIDVWEGTDQIVEDLPAVRKYSFKCGVNIMYGCNNFCSYCIVPYVRGRERSRQPEDIIKEIKQLVADGVVEVMLLGQNVNSYGKTLDNPITFAQLLQQVEQIEGLRWIRFMTSHPKDLSDELIEVMKNSKKICRHLHLPLQSGSSRILKLMNRKYDKEQYLELAAKLRREIPDLSLTTDIIVGFPGETEEDFEDTMDVVRKVQYDSAFTFIYSKRTGTPAAAMDDQIPEEVVKDRFDRLLKLVQSIATTQCSRDTGKTLEVLVEEVNEKDPSMVSGRLSNNTVVHFKGDSSLIGTICKVKMIESKGFYYLGELVE